MSPHEVPLDWLASQISGTRARDVHLTVEKLINAGTLLPGSQLPTIRELAEQLDTKVSAVTDAWVMLRRDGLVETRRRGGTRVVGPRGHGRPERPGPTSWSEVELVHVLPDPALLPDTASTFRASVDPTRPFGRSSRVSPALVSALRETWPFVADSFAATTGGRTAFTLAVQAALGSGPRIVAAEMPGLLRTAEALAELDAEVLPVHGDAEGPLPDSLERALDAGAGVFTFQPSARIPTGSTLTPKRRDQLARLLEGRQVWVVEEDAVGPLFGSASLGETLPHLTVRLMQYWRAFGPDVELVTVGGAEHLMSRIRAGQLRNGQRASGLQQEVVARLLRDPEVLDQVAAAGERYQRRNAAFADALSAQGVQVHSHGGLAAWIPVPHAPDAVSSLAALGIRVLASRGGSAGSEPETYLRIATTRLPERAADLDDLAATLVAATNHNSIADTE